MNPIIIIDPPITDELPRKEKTVTIYKMMLFEDLDAETRRFTMMRPDAPGYQSDITASNMNIQETPYVFSKERTVTIVKQNLYDDIDAETYKFMEGNSEAPSQKSNSFSADTAERLDGHIIARLVENGDANLRKRLMRYLKNENVVTSATDTMTLDSSLVYEFILSTEFNDSMMETVKNLIHRYLVWSALFEWYGASLGSEQAKWFQNTLAETVNSIIWQVSRIDGHLAIRHLNYRDAKLRRLISFALKDSEVIISANDQMVLNEHYVYNLEVFEQFKDAMLQPLTEYIHRYLVWGALYDWYGSSIGDSQAKFYAGELKELENGIRDLLIGPSVGKRPLQPFGPAKKMLV